MSRQRSSRSCAEASTRIPDSVSVTSGMSVRRARAHSTVAHALRGTEYGIRPFWSQDSKSIGFFADGRLKRIDADGGPALALANAVSARGGAWNRDEVILFAPSFGGPILKVSASGGEA